MLKAQFMALLRRLPDTYEVLVPSASTGMWHEPTLTSKDSTAFIEITPGLPYAKGGDQEPHGAIATPPAVPPKEGTEQEEEILIAA